MHDPHDSQAAYPFLWLSSHLNLPVSYLLLSFTSETTSRQSCLLCGNYSMPGRQRCIRAFGHCKSSMLHTLWAPLPSWRICVVPFMGTSSSDGSHMCLMHLASVWITVSLFVSLLPCPHLKYHPCDEVSKVIIFIPSLIQTARFIFQLLSCVCCMCMFM